MLKKISFALAATFLLVTIALAQGSTIGGDGVGSISASLPADLIVQPFTSLQIDSAGVLLDSDGDGALTITGQGDGFDESVTYNLDDVENTMGVSSPTGVTTIDYGAINLTTTGTLSGGTLSIGGNSTGDITVSNATPDYNFKDTDATDSDINASISTNLTNTGSGTEETTMSFKGQTGGVLTEFGRYESGASNSVYWGVGDLIRLAATGNFASWKAGMNVFYPDLTDLIFGTGADIDIEWDTNGTGDDLLNINFQKLSANDTNCFLIGRNNDPNNMNTFDDCISPTMVFLNTNGADSGDASAMLIGAHNQLATGDHDFYIGGTTVALDGSADATTTETVANIVLGSVGSFSWPYDATNAQDVGIANNLVVLGSAIFNGSVGDLPATCAVGEHFLDIGGATVEQCTCYSPDQWACTTVTTTSGPTD